MYATVDIELDVRAASSSSPIRHRERRLRGAQLGRRIAGALSRAPRRPSPRLDYRPGTGPSQPPGGAREDAALWLCARYPPQPEMSATWRPSRRTADRDQSYELTGHDREFGDFTRPSTVVHLRGGGQEGIGEDVVYDVLDHIAHRDAGPVLDLDGAGDSRRGLRAARRARPVPGRAAGARRLAPLPPLGVRVGGARPRAAPERAFALGGRRARPAAAALRLLDPPLELRRRRQVLDRADPQPPRHATRT